MAYLVQRRHANENVAAFKHCPAIAKQEGQQEGADVSTIHIYIGQDNNLRAALTFQGTQVNAASGN